MFHSKIKTPYSEIAIGALQPHQKEYRDRYRIINAKITDTTKVWCNKKSYSKEDAFKLGLFNNCDFKAIIHVSAIYENRHLITLGKITPVCLY